LTDYSTLIVWHLTFPAMELVNADTPFLPTALDPQNRILLAVMAACRRPVRATDGHEDSLEDLPIRGIDVHQQQVFSDTTDIWNRGPAPAGGTRDR